MSEYETYSGIIKEIATDLKTKQQKLKYLKDNYNIEPNEETEQFIFVNNKLFKVLEVDEHYTGEIYITEKLEDNKIKFIIQYYNGGCSFSEALEDAIKQGIE